MPHGTRPPLADERAQAIARLHQRLRPHHADQARGRQQPSRARQALLRAEPLHVRREERMHRVAEHVCTPRPCRRWASPPRAARSRRSSAAPAPASPPARSTVRSGTARERATVAATAARTTDAARSRLRDVLVDGAPPAARCHTRIGTLVALALVRLEPQLARRAVRGTCRQREQRLPRHVRERVQPLALRRRDTHARRQHEVVARPREADVQETRALLLLALGHAPALRRLLRVLRERHSLEAAERPRPVADPPPRQRVLRIEATAAPTRDTPRTRCDAPRGRGSTSPRPATRGPSHGDTCRR